MKYLLISLYFFISSNSLALSEPSPVLTAAKKSKPDKKSATNTPTPSKTAKGSSQNTLLQQKALLRDIHGQCMAKFPRTVDQRKKTCDCLTRNFALKLNNEDLAYLLNDFKTADAKKGKTPPKEDPKEMLLMFSMDASEACIQNPNWKLGDPE